MSWFSSAAQRLGIAGELLSFFAQHKRWWLLPVITVVRLSAFLIILAQTSALAPFIYSLF